MWRFRGGRGMDAKRGGGVWQEGRQAWHQGASEEACCLLGRARETKREAVVKVLQSRSCGGSPQATG
eukprot:3356156-Lingulodinium_polyedra.AAC.1